MAEQTSSSIVVDAPPSAVMDVIADFPAYPEWAKGVKEATVRAEGAQGRADEVYFALDVAPIKDEYTLSYTWNGDRDVSWTLAEGKMLRALDGAYELRDLGDGSTEVTYRLALDVSIPLIGMIKRKGEKILIDTALKGLKQRVESLQA
jgi:ribosome-associated toxin RatA of RatAB toxin-antitoxin module